MFMEDFTKRQLGQEVAFIILNGSFSLFFDTVCSGEERLITEEKKVNNTNAKVVIAMMMRRICPD